MRKIQVAIVEDQRMFRDCLCLVLSHCDDIQIWGQASDGKEFIEMLNESESQPDVCLLDIKMSGMDGIDVLKWIRETKSAIKPIIISQYEEETFANLTISSGACAYLTKNVKVDEIEKAIHCVYNGKFYFNEIVSRKTYMKLSENYFMFQEEENENDITRREKEIILLMCQSKSHQEIADELNISIKTVSNHRDSIFRKIGCNKVNDVILYALKRGWV